MYKWVYKFQDGEVINNMDFKGKKEEAFISFEGYDRFDFPEPIRRVTAGHGGEALLILGSEKTALYDCGMAYCWKQMLENLEKSLEGRTLDYVLVSHTHYDHIGALPYLRERYPEAVVFGAEHAARVFERHGARKIMKRLGEEAMREYCGDEVEIKTQGLSVDVIVREGERIDLGDRYFRVIETPGHTDCSLSFLLEPDGILFASESTGVLLTPEIIHTPMLKSYEDCMDSAKKCADLKPKFIVIPHYGVIPGFFNEKYWQLFNSCAQEKCEFIKTLHDEGLSGEEILGRYADHYWDDIRANEQPWAAYMMNAENIVKTILGRFK